MILCFLDVEYKNTIDICNKYTIFITFYNDISTFLDQYGIMIRGGQHCCQPFMKKMNIPGSCRASFGIYNDINDIDILVDSLEKTVKLLQ